MVGFRVQSLGIRVQGSGFRFPGVELDLGLAVILPWKVSGVSTSEFPTLPTLSLVRGQFWGVAATTSWGEEYHQQPLAAYKKAAPCSNFQAKRRNLSRSPGPGTEADVT
jgi:hypothetical protein